MPFPVGDTFFYDHMCSLNQWEAVSTIEKMCSSEYDYHFYEKELFHSLIIAIQLGILMLGLVVILDNVSIVMHRLLNGVLDSLALRLQLKFVLV